MKFPVWPLRIIILLYFFYKMFLSDPSGPFLSLEFEGKSVGSVVGVIIVALLFTIISGLFYFYQIRQGLIEVKRSIEITKIRFRLFSIVFSMIFFSLCGLSLVNVDFSKLELMSYIFELYTLFTLVAVLASIIVIVRDIKLFRERLSQRF